MFRCYQCNWMKCGITATFLCAACRGRRVSGPICDVTSVDGPSWANEGTFDICKRPSVQGRSLPLGRQPENASCEAVSIFHSRQIARRIQRHLSMKITKHEIPCCVTKLGLARHLY